MAKQHTISFTCPACGKVSDFTVTDSVDLDADPEIAKSIMDLSAFQHKCSCGSVLPVRFPMLCTSRELNLAACLLTERSQIDMLPAASGKAPLRLRAVLTPDWLREIILIFRNGLDDRAVVMLEMAMKKTMAKHKLKVSDLLFTGIEKTDEETLLLFHAVMQNGTAQNASWPMTFYEKMYSEFVEKLPESGKYQFYDEIWAEKLLQPE